MTWALETKVLLVEVVAVVAVVAVVVVVEVVEVVEVVGVVGAVGVVGVDAPRQWSSFMPPTSSLPWASQSWPFGDGSGRQSLPLLPCEQGPCPGGAAGGPAARTDVPPPASAPNASTSGAANQMSFFMSFLSSMGSCRAPTARKSLPIELAGEEASVERRFRCPPEIAGRSARVTRIPLNGANALSRGRLVSHVLGRHGRDPLTPETRGRSQQARPQGPSFQQNF
jgi:hypothetical protein